MSDKLEKYTFNGLLEHGSIRIPRIQRGYAQGRKSGKVHNIRKVFLHTLFQVIRGNRSGTELDFIYGSDKDGAFEPLDGQQRLTTLFLIHWMLGTPLRRADDTRKSVFTYASCTTSEDFSNALVQHDPVQFLRESGQKGTVPSALVRKRDWFLWEWRYDPSVSSMLVMLDAIYGELTADPTWEKSIDTYRANLNHITFNRLNLGDFGLSNELFIKMNARGKQLSDFDKLKSTLEEELQIQQKEKDKKGDMLASPKDEADWRSLMDGKWSDYFWHKYARAIMIDSESQDTDMREEARLNAAKTCERQFKKFLLRIIQLSLHSAGSASESLREACYRMDENQIDSFLGIYSDVLLGLRSTDEHVVPDSCATIAFRTVMDTVCGILYRDRDGDVCDVFQLLPRYTRIDTSETLVESFLDEKVANDVALIFYAALLFLRVFPLPKSGTTESDGYTWEFDETAHGGWLKNFADWVIAMRNILLNDNNNQRIDKQYRYERAIDGITAMARDLADFKTTDPDPETDKHLVTRFLHSLADKTYIGLDNQSLKEGTMKAALILTDAEWETQIREAESDPYLWGQIRSLISWGGEDLCAFSDYASRLTALLGYIAREGNKYYLAMLKFRPDFWKGSNRLYQLNRHRDNSFKRYLREHAGDGHPYGICLKQMIDDWRDRCASEPVDDYIAMLLADKTVDVPIWLQCMIVFPEILDECWHKRIYETEGHLILAQLQTTDSHCIDPVFRYLYKTAQANGCAEKATFYDSKGDYPHAFGYRDGKDSLLARWKGDEGLYTLMVNEDEPQDMTASELLAYLVPRIQYTPAAP